MRGVIFLGFGLRGREIVEVPTQRRRRIRHTVCRILASYYFLRLSEEEAEDADNDFKEAEAEDEEEGTHRAWAGRPSLPQRSVAEAEAKCLLGERAVQREAADWEVGVASAHVSADDFMVPVQGALSDNYMP